MDFLNGLYYNLTRDNKSYDDKDKKLVFYMTSPVTYILWKRYEYGFYFSEEDKALNIVWGVEECKSGTEIRGKYWDGTTIYYSTFPPV